MNWLILLLMFAQPEPRPVPVPHEIRLPEVQSPTPPPLPPNAVQTLEADKYYIVDSDVECFVRAVPGGLLSIAVEAGPVKLPTKLLVEGGKTKFKTFGGKYIYLVEAIGTGNAQLLIVPKGVQTDKEIIQRSIDAQTGPRPPPVPPKPPGPLPPTPDAAPIPEAGLHVLIVYETANAKGPEAAIVGSIEIRKYLNSKCPNDADGKAQAYRIWDQNVDPRGDLKVWQDAFARPRKSVPWIIVSNPGRGGYEGPLPADVNATLALLKKYGD